MTFLIQVDTSKHWGNLAIQNVLFVHYTVIINTGKVDWYILEINIYSKCLFFDWGFLGGSDGKESAYNAGDLGLIPGSGKSPGEGNGNLLQCSCLDNPMDGGAWRATFHGIAESDMTERLTTLFSLTRCFVCINLNEIDVINLNLQMRKLKPRGVK